MGVIMLGIDDINRLERENERLKEEINYRKAITRDMYISVKKYKKALKEIKEIALEAWIVGENCMTCNSNCMNKDILNKINEVLEIGKEIYVLQEIENNVESK